jgi:hypothetical protein
MVIEQLIIRAVEELTAHEDITFQIDFILFFLAIIAGVGGILAAYFRNFTKGREDLDKINTRLDVMANKVDLFWNVTQSEIPRMLLGATKSHEEGGGVQSPIGQQVPAKKTEFESSTQLLLKTHTNGNTKEAHSLAQALLEGTISKQEAEQLKIELQQQLREGIAERSPSLGIAASFIILRLEALIRDLG